MGDLRSIEKYAQDSTPQARVSNVEAYGIYMDADEIHVRVYMDGMSRAILNIPAVYIFNDLNEVLTGNRAFLYQKCHKEKQLHSVLGFLKESERFQSSVITESAEKNCRVLMKELKKRLDKITQGRINECVVTVASSDLKVQRAVRLAMEDAGFSVLRQLSVASACAISKSYPMKQNQKFMMCVAANGEKQSLLADYEDGILEIVESTFCPVSCKMPDNNPELMKFYASDTGSRRELGREAAIHENLAMVAADGAVIEGLILTGRTDLLSVNYLLLDLCPWKLGIEILEEDGTACVPLTWIIQEQASIPVRKKTERILPGRNTRDKTLRLYAQAGENKESRSVIREWILDGSKMAGKNLEAMISISTDCLKMEVELDVEGHKTSVAYLQESKSRRSKVPVSDVCVPDQMLRTVLDEAGIFSIRAGRLDAVEIDSSIKKGIQLIAKQTDSIFNDCRSLSGSISIDAFVEKMIAAADNLEYGIKGLAKSTGKTECWDTKDLLWSFYRIINDNLLALNVTSVEAEGMYFDPYVHHAMMEEEIAGVGKNVITEEIQKGYFLGDKLLRPAKVKVSK